MIARLLIAIAGSEKLEPITLHPYIIDTLMPDLVGHDRHPSAFLVFLFLHRRTEMGACAVSLRQIAEGTGLSKRAIQSALTRLVKRKLVSIERAGITAIPKYRIHQPWCTSQAHE
ncbi:Helix-turn-helix domain-containing protein [Sulfidibacter corallicola]|uniref:Helix-turn-helix domain-containing protein n=1 Tax=Sulfidibacter corallicola TaxID=2818388 RepID=A0A8A4TKC6_SULCO|nr:helix-turn-helix domain-containing protein [Sulfidibacter corallicola]QTD49592.1 helix-turn-helix domain-containing protein [Sulfidibacter corallicola]